MKKITIQYLFTFIITLSITLLSAHQSKMRKGPYLLYPNNNEQMTVLWQLDRTDTCQLKWGTTPDYLVGRITTGEINSGINGHQHIYTITNLIPGQKYYYQITENSIAHRGSFQSAPFYNATSVSFYIYGDTRTYPANQNSVLARMIYEINADTTSQTILLHCGDWTSDDSEASWDIEFFKRNFSNILTIQSVLPIQGTRGNHEKDAIRYTKYFPYPYDGEGCYYSFKYGPVHIFVVDQYVDYSLGSTQSNWLEKDLASSNSVWKFILLHEPGYTDEAVHKNNYEVQKRIQPLCIKYKVKAIFAGHNHYYAHCLVKGIHHLTLGGGGAPLYNTSQIGFGLIKSESVLHFAKVSVISDSLNIKIIRPDGTIIESFSIPEEFIDTNTITEEEYKFKIYVTPVNMMLVINIKNYENLAITILNIKGQNIFSKEIEKNNIKLDLSPFSDGIYFIRIRCKGDIKTKKIAIF